MLVRRALVAAAALLFALLVVAGCTNGGVGEALYLRQPYLRKTGLLWG